MSSNDKTIEDYRKKIETKRTKLGKAPKVNYKSNGVLQINGESYNLNILIPIRCREVLEELVLKQVANDRVNTILNTNEASTLRGVLVQDYIDDIVQRINKFKWQTEKKELDVMDKQLADLLSNETKATNAITDIGKTLGLN